MRQALPWHQSGRPSKYVHMILARLPEVLFQSTLRAFCQYKLCFWLVSVVVERALCARLFGQIPRDVVERNVEYFSFNFMSLCWTLVHVGVMLSETFLRRRYSPFAYVATMTLQSTNH